MILDSSAVLAVILAEPDSETFLNAIVDAAHCRISSVNWFEASMVVDGRGDLEVGRRFDELFVETSIEIVAFMPDQARIARRAWQRYGRGRHPARLNYGDCMAYALAVSAREPLLFKGDDFSRTDIVSALPA